MNLKSQINIIVKISSYKHVGNFPSEWEVVLEQPREAYRCFGKAIPSGCQKDLPPPSCVPHFSGPSVATSLSNCLELVIMSQLQDLGMPRNQLTQRPFVF